MQLLVSKGEVYFNFPWKFFFPNNYCVSIFYQESGIMTFGQQKFVSQILTKIRKDIQSKNMEINIIKHDFRDYSMAF